MSFFLTGNKCRVEGEVSPSGDKSIAHRALFLSAISPGKTLIENFPASDDCLCTLKILNQLGIRVRSYSKTRICVFGKGLYGLKKPSRNIYIKESGTTFRLLLGILAGQDFTVKLVAGKFLSSRPMLRVTEPLRKMGAKITANPALPAGRREPQTLPAGEAGANREEYPPITIRGGDLKGITYKMPMASAQVKSAILLAGLYALGPIKIIEPVKTRDHTERMLKLFKSGIRINRNNILLQGGKGLISPRKIYIPGDISSASFFLVLASILPGSKLVIKNVGLNPSRCGIIKVLKRMGANIATLPSRQACLSGRQAGRLQTTGSKFDFEPLGDLIIKSSKLKGTVIRKEEIPSLIDELPILMVAASFAKGKSIFQGTGELRVKETDRIKSMSESLRNMGADIEVYRSAKSEDIIIQGKGELRGAIVSSFNDHRTAMSLIVAGFKAKGRTVIDDVSCISKSFPGFIGFIKKIVIQS